MFRKLRQQQQRALLATNDNRRVRKNDIASGKSSIIEKNVAPSRIGHEALTFVIDRKQQIHVNLQVGEEYKILTNIQRNKFNNAHVQQSFRDVIRETISSHLPYGLDIEIERLDSSHNSVFYRIISKATQKENTTTTSSADENDVVQVDRLDLPQTTNIGAHPSLRPHLRVYGKALIAWLRHKGYLNDDIESALQIDDDEVDVTSWGIYLKILNAYEEIEVEKTGFTKKYHGRRTGGKYTSTDDLRVYCDFSKLDYETDIGIQYIMRQFFQDVRNDIEVPAPIKRMLCEKFHDLGGGRFGGMDVFTGKTIEAGDQYIRGQCVVGEHCQFDDSYFHCMRGKILETRLRIKPIIALINPHPDKDCDCQSSWAPAPHPDPVREREIMYLTPAALAYAGTPHDASKDSFVGPARPGAVTSKDRWSDAYNEEQLIEAWKRLMAALRRKGGLVLLLDINSSLCKKMKKNIHTTVVNESFDLKANLYGGEVSLYVDEEDKSLTVTHGAPCRSGDVRAIFTLNDNAQGCMNLETMHDCTRMSKCQPLDGPMLAIEAAMAQRFLINGLGQNTLMRGLIVREYVASGKGAFDKYGGNKNGSIRHYPLYPMAQKNKAEYSKRI